MERSIEINDILLLFDHYNEDSHSLFISFRLAGYDCPASVIEDDGFLPEDVISVYGFFLGNYRVELGEKVRPKYFNEITVPEYWEISGNNNIGEVHNLQRERAKIFYAEPKHKRLVKAVDWYDERGIVRSSDHYNRYGKVYARTIFNADGKRVNKSYFSAEGKECIVENYVTGDIILNDEGTKIFRNKTDFVLYFITKAGFERKRIFFNSLSTPFFVSNKLGTVAVKRDILFWQEPVGTAIPGNMQLIFKEQASRTAKIMVQKRVSYDKLLALGAKRDMIDRLGFVYPFEKENFHGRDALICTNSDNIERCSEVAQALPQVRFHIAALTEMSSKLMSLDVYDNVNLYPGIKPVILEELFAKCDFYFDINHEREIVSAVRKAFLHNHLIFAFAETVHNRDYIAEAHIYPASDMMRMIGDVQAVLADEKCLEEHLKWQQEAGMVETVEEYVTRFS